MEATYNVGSDVDVCRMFDQYLYKRSENIDFTLSVPHHYSENEGTMNDQTFHTPSFGDEEFDIPLIHMQQQQQVSGMHQQHLHQYAQHNQGPQMGMINPAQDGLSLTDGQPSYQQPLYLQPQEHTLHSTYGNQQPSGNYLIQQQPSGQRLLVMQPPQQPSYGRSPPQPSPAASVNTNDPHTTTSEDSDDSTPHHASLQPGDAESFLPIHYCSASRRSFPTHHQQIGAGNVKRPSPEPTGPDGSHLQKQLVKKPKVQKKKKKRDPNEPQKPVSAYALFFRDTQAAIKGQNPNASFGEVSKIVASMWDGLDSEHKSVYKQKTETAKKEYLKALAAYRASLVSKVSSESDNGMYGSVSGNSNNGPYSGFYQGTGPTQIYDGHSPPTPSRSPLVSPPHHISVMGMHHPAMAPLSHHHHHHHHQQQQPYIHHPHTQPLSSPHQSPQHHLPPGPMGPQVITQHLGQQTSPGSQSQQLTPPVQSPQQVQMNQQPQNQQMHNTVQTLNQQQQPNNQQTSQLGQQTQVISTGQVNQNMPSHQINNQNQQIKSPQGPNLGMSNLGVVNHQSPPHDKLQAQHQMNSHQISQQQPNGSSDTSFIRQGQTVACIRHGCTNPAINNIEWEDEYCSNECVVSHCRDVFSSWVASNSNQTQSYSAVK